MYNLCLPSGPLRLRQGHHPPPAGHHCAASTSATLVTRAKSPHGHREGAAVDASSIVFASVAAFAVAGGLCPHQSAAAATIAAATQEPAAATVGAPSASSTF